MPANPLFHLPSHFSLQLRTIEKIRCLEVGEIILFLYRQNAAKSLDFLTLKFAESTPLSYISKRTGGVRNMTETRQHVDNLTCGYVDIIHPIYTL